MAEINELALRLLINHLDNIVESLEDKILAHKKHAPIFTTLQVDGKREVVIKELLPLQSIIETLKQEIGTQGAPAAALPPWLDHDGIPLVDDNEQI